VRIITPRLVSAMHAAGVEVHAWTINDAATMERLLAIGVDGLVTDRADLALELLRRRH
jgi:glycerophosphoryl diester phosphodiesterase